MFLALPAVWSEVLVVEARSIMLSVHVHRSRTFTCRNWGVDKLFHILLKVCPAHGDQAEIKCMGSVGGKTPTEPKVYSSLALGILSTTKLMSIYFIQSLHG
jgi:hypothetical protein